MGERKIRIWDSVTKQMLDILSYWSSLNKQPVRQELSSFHRFSNWGPKRLGPSLPEPLFFLLRHKYNVGSHWHSLCQFTPLNNWLYLYFLSKEQLFPDLPREALLNRNNVSPGAVRTRPQHKWEARKICLGLTSLLESCPLLLPGPAEAGGPHHVEVLFRRKPDLKASNILVQCKSNRNIMQGIPWQSSG